MRRIEFAKRAKGTDSHTRSGVYWKVVDMRNRRGMLRNKVTVVGTIQEWLLDGEEVLLAERAEQIGVLDGKRFVSPGSVALTRLRFWYEDEVLRDRGRQFGMGSTEQRWYEDITACDAEPTGRAWTLTVQVRGRTDQFVVSEAFATKFRQFLDQWLQGETSPVDKYRLAMEALAVEAREQAEAIGDAEAELFYGGLEAGLIHFRNYPKPMISLDGTFPMDRGHKQGWELMTAVRRNVQAGIDPPAVVLPEFSDQDRVFAPGWIEALDTATSWEGVFDDSRNALIFRVTKGRDLGPRGSIPWSQVSWVRFVPLSDLPPALVEARSPILGKAIDGNVLYGSLRGSGRPTTEMFGLVGTALRSGAEWLKVFRTGGVKVRE